MVQRFFFNRIDRQSARATIGGGDQLVALPPPDIAQAVMPLIHAAVSRAQVALNPAVVPQMPVFRRFHNAIITLFFQKGIL